MSTQRSVRWHRLAARRYGHEELAPAHRFPLTQHPQDLITIHRVSELKDALS